VPAISDVSVEMMAFACRGGSKGDQCGHPCRRIVVVVPPSRITLEGLRSVGNTGHDGRVEIGGCGAIKSTVQTRAAGARRCGQYHERAQPHTHCYGITVCLGADGSPENCAGCTPAFVEQSRDSLGIGWRWRGLGGGAGWHVNIQAERGPPTKAGR
jgi:hypothetical protein